MSDDDLDPKKLDAHLWTEKPISATYYTDGGAVFTLQNEDHIINFAQYNGRLIVITNRGVYELIENELVPLAFLAVEPPRIAPPLGGVEAEQQEILPDEVAAHIELHGEEPQPESPGWREKRGLR